MRKRISDPAMRFVCIDRIGATKSWGGNQRGMGRSLWQEIIGTFLDYYVRISYFKHILSKPHE